MESSSVSELFASLSELCAKAGLELSQQFSTWDQEQRGITPLFQEPWFGRLTHPGFADGLTKGEVVGLAIGNSKALWPRFIEWTQVHARDLEQIADPLDHFVEVTVREAARSAFVGIEHKNWTVLFAHDLEPEPCPIQRIFDHAGLAYMSPSALCVHPTHGPWIGLRAVVFVRATQPRVNEPSVESLPSSPCSGCSAPCRAPFHAALADSVGLAQPPRSSGSSRLAGSMSLAASDSPLRLSKNSQMWLAVRDACPVGTKSRYSEKQLIYHYDKDRRALFE